MLPDGARRLDDPLEAVGALVHAETKAFLGSGFALRQPNCFITAAHCVGLLPPEAFCVSPLRNAATVGVTEIVRHPRADVALLRLARDDQLNPLYDVPIRPDRTIGDDLMAYGFSEDIFGDDTRLPMPRLFKGHIQRIYWHQSKMDAYAYRAAELSFPAPGGLSGGPVFPSANPTWAAGLVSENLQSTTFLEAVEEIVRPEHYERTRYVEVVSYGVAVLLGDLRPWININIPKHPIFAHIDEPPDWPYPDWPWPVD